MLKTVLKNPAIKRVGALLLVVIIVVPLVITVSGLGSEDKDDEPPVVFEGITLTESFTNQESGITVRYPEGWFAQADGTSIVVSNSATAMTDPMPGEGDIAFTVLPLPLASLKATDLDGAFNAMASVLTADTTTTRAGEVTYSVLNNREIRQMAIYNESQGDTALFAWIDGSDLIVTMGMAPNGDLDDVLPYAKAMTATLKVD